MIITINMVKFTQLLVIFITLQIVFSEHNHRKVLEKYMNGPTKELFKMYHGLFEKEYSLNSEEGFRKYKTFKDNLNYIKEHNSKNTESQLAIGPWADLSNQEYIDTVLTHPNVMQANIQKSIEEATPFETSENKNFFNFDRFADEVDDTEYIAGDYQAGEKNWKEYDTPVRSQGRCGSCWAYGVTAAVEVNAAIASGCKRKNDCNQPHYSTQYLVDCTTDNGCRGGWYDKSLNMMKARGLVLDSAYPYKAKEMTCPKPIPQTDKTKKVTGFNHCYNCTKQKWNDMASKGAVAVAVDASNRNFQHFGSGKLTELTNCNRVNHAVVVVSSVGGTIIIKNSWGNRWGDKGYLSIKRTDNNNTCHITKYAFLPIVQSNGPNPSPNPSPNPRPKPSPSPNPNPSPQPDRVYDSPMLCKGVFNSCTRFDGFSYKKLYSRQDTAVSFVMGKAIKSAYLFDENYCKGRGVKLTKHYDDFSKYDETRFIYKRARSFTVIKTDVKDNCVMVGSYECFYRETEMCGEGILKLTNYRIKSVRFGKNVKRVDIFEEINGKGNGYSLTKSSGNLGNLETERFQQNVRAIKIYSN